MRLIDDFDKYSDLILSVKTHEKERPLVPIEVSKYISRMIKELPSENLLQISRRLHLNDASQTKYFLKLLELPEKVHYLLGWKVYGEEKIPFTIGVILLDLKNKDDIEYVLKSGLDHKFTKNEAQRIVQYKKNFPEKSIEECVEQVLKIRPVIEKGYLVIAVLKEDHLAKMRNISEMKNISRENLVLDLVNEKLATGKATSVRIKRHVLQIFMDENGYRELLKLQEEMKVRFNDIIPKLMEKKFHD